MTGIAASFGKPFAWQVAAFRLRLAQLLPTFKWTDVWKSEHDRAFMVAGAVKADILADLAAMVDKAITQGTTLEEFRRDFRAMVAEKGWQISKAGQGTKKGEAWRTKVIYKTNMATSYAAGRWAQLKAANYPFIVYKHGGSLHPRLHHLNWDGLVLEADHPFWLTHAPPNGWGCSCYVTGARSRAAAKRVGGNPDLELPKDWHDPDPKTGVMPGIDKGWDYAPGASVAETVGAMATRTVAWPYEIAKAFMTAVPAGHRDALADAYRTLPSTARAINAYATAVLSEGGAAASTGQTRLTDYFTMGLLRADQAAEFGAVLQQDVAGFDFSLSRSAVLHVLNRHGDAATESGRGQVAITAANMEDLLALVGHPDSVTRSGDDIVMTKAIGGKSLTAVFKRLAKRRMLTLVSFWIGN